MSLSLVLLQTPTHIMLISILLLTYNGAQTGILLNSPMHTHSYNKGFTHTLAQLKLSDAGEYNCLYYLTSANDSPYIKQSEVNTGVTTVRVKSEFKLIVSHLLLYSS